MPLLSDTAPHGFDFKGSKVDAVRNRNLSLPAQEFMVNGSRSADTYCLPYVVESDFRDSPPAT